MTKKKSAGHKKTMKTLTFKVTEGEYDLIKVASMRLSKNLGGMKLSITDYIRLLLETSVFADMKAFAEENVSNPVEASTNSSKPFDGDPY